MKQYLKKLCAHQALSDGEAYEVLCALIEGEGATDAQVGAYLYSTSARELESPEIVGAARFLREKMVRVELHENARRAGALDTCGTGGSGLHLFTVSTAAAFVCAAAGVYVAKHGNRGASSLCGSVDVLEALGVKFDLSPEQIADCCERTKFGFMFAPKHHPATARVGRIRRELGIATIFNFLGPLANPACASRQLLGVSRKSVMRIVAEALLGLGSVHALVVHGEDGLDEVTLSGITHVYEVKNGAISEDRVDPRDFRFALQPHDSLRPGSPQEAACWMRKVFAGEAGPVRDYTILNSAAALYAGGASAGLREGVQTAIECIDSGLAAAKLEEVIEVTNSYGAPEQREGRSGK